MMTIVDLGSFGNAEMEVEYHEIEQVKHTTALCMSHSLESMHYTAHGLIIPRAELLKEQHTAKIFPQTA